jgi:hypothetical protein
MDWFSYMRKRGSLNIGRRIEVSTALLAFMFNKSKGGRSKFSDFTPHEIEESKNDINDVMKLMKAIPNTKRKRHTPRKK